MTVYAALAALFLAQMQHQGMHHDMPAAPAPAPVKKETAGLTLEYFEQLALEHNPTIAQAGQVVARSAALGRQAGLFPNPEAGYQGEQIRGGSYGGGEQGGFVQQTFPLGGKLGLRRRAFEERRKEAAIGETEQRLRVKADIGREFYQALASQEMVKVRRELAAVARDAVETTKQLANVGLSDTPGILQAEVEAEQAALDYDVAERMHARDFRMLTALAGQPGLTTAELQGDLRNPPAMDATQLAAEMVGDSPWVKQAEQAIARSEAELKSARREAIPDLTIRAGLQQNFEHLGDLSNRSVGLQGFASAGITLPLFNRNQGNVEAARADVERSKQEVARVQLWLTRAVQPVLESYLSEQARAARYRSEMIPRAERAYKLYLDKYRQMASAYPQVIVSHRTLLQLQAAYVQSLGRLWAASIELQNFLLTGGLDALM